MANTVISAFNKFLANDVNLGSSQSSSARSSRDWLLGQINNFSSFFPLYKSCYVIFKMKFTCTESQTDLYQINFIGKLNKKMKTKLILQ